MVRVLIYRFCFFVCTTNKKTKPIYRDFSGEDKASGVKFARCFMGCRGRGISHFGELLPQKPKIRRIGHAPGSKVCLVRVGKSFRNRVPVNIARRVDIGSACVDIRPSPKMDVLVFL